MDAIDNTLSNTMFTVGTSLAAFGVAVLTVAYVFFAILYIYQLNQFGLQGIFPYVLGTSDVHCGVISLDRKALPEY